MEKAYREHGDVLAEHPISDPSLESALSGREAEKPANEVPV